ncbi:porin [Phenylobacterium sp.]|uniref:OprO/OprP family phosphate-selective porin n=1 Tax=Phenylobacterium sp. TaxID=1871053 RepID=UPI00286B9FBF|nr:porin [Phenylobacterium sp.]
MGISQLAACRVLLAAAGLSGVWTPVEAAPRQGRVAPDPRDAQIQALKAQVEALSARVDSLAARPAPPLSPPAPAPAPTSAAILQTEPDLSTPAQVPSAGGMTIVAGRPSIESADGRFSAKLHGVMQFDAADYKQATPGPIIADFRRGAAGTDTAHARDLNSGSNFRRARIGIEGKAFGDWDYNLLFEFGGAGEEDAGHIQEMWAQYSGLKPFHVRIGAFPPSIGLEDQGSTNGALFLERPASADMARSLTGGDFREAGQFWGGTDRWYVSGAVSGRVVGVVNSQATGVTQPFDTAVNYVGRVAFVPVRTDDAMLELGVHGGYVARPADAGGPDTPAGTSRYPITIQERPELRVDGTRLVSTGAINARRASTLGIEASGQVGSLFLQSEYERFRIARLNPAPGVSDPEFHGWYVEGGWTVTGERRRFNAATFAWDSPLVDHPFSLADRTWGAWELAGRYSDMNLNYHAGAVGTAPGADALRGGDQRIVTAGVNWFPNTFFRLMLDFQDVRIRRLSPSAATFQTPAGAEIGQHYRVLMLRTQFAF